MGKFLSKSIVRRMNAIILPVIAICLIGIGALVSTYYYMRVIADLKSAAANTVELAAIALRNPVWNYDQDTLRSVASAIMVDQNVVKLQVFSGSGEASKDVLLSESRPDFENVPLESLRARKDIIYMEFPITEKQERIGSVHIATTTTKAVTLIQRGTVFVAITVTLLILILSAVVTLSARKTIKLPITHLEVIADKLSRGHLEEVIDVSRADELGRLAQSFANMRDSIKKHFAELETLNRDLDDRVQVRTKELTTAYNQLKKAQATLVQSEKMASLGQMVAGVAHEINTPLGYVKNNVEMFAELVNDLSAHETRIKNIAEVLVSPRTVDSRLDAVQEIVDQSLISAGGPDTQQTQQLVTDSIEGLERISEIVVALKNFSRLDRAKVDSFDVNHGLNSTLKIAQNLLKGRIDVIKDYGTVPKINCAASKINQVFLNIITNAAQATEGEGTIKITTRARAKFIRIKIADTGEGIPKDILSKICDPFFTTKPVGQGTGLGLSISHTIIEDEHHGKLRFISEVGKGTTAIIMLPIGDVESVTEKAANG